MKLLLAALLLLLSMALICSPLYLVYIGFVGSDVSFWVRVVLVMIGLGLCRSPSLSSRARIGKCFRIQSSVLSSPTAPGHNG